MSRVYAVALNTFREAVRDRILQGILVVGALGLLFVLVLAELALDQRQRLIEDLSLAMVSLFSIMTAIFLGSSLLHKEMERRTLYLVLPRPIRRWEFLLGKYLGICLTLVVFIAAMGAMAIWLVCFEQGGGGSAIWVPPLVLGVFGPVIYLKMRDRALFIPVLSALALGACVVLVVLGQGNAAMLFTQIALACAEILLLVGVTIFFSSFTTSFFTGLFSLGIWILGRSADDMVTLTDAHVGAGIQALLVLLAEVVPNFNLFVPGPRVLMLTEGGPYGYLMGVMLYAVLYTATLLWLASKIFQRRDMV